MDIPADLSAASAIVTGGGSGLGAASRRYAAPSALRRALRNALGDMPACRVKKRLK